MLTLLDALAFLLINTWIWSGNFIRFGRFMGRRMSVAGRLFHELRPFYWPAVCVNVATNALDGFSIGDPLQLGCWALCWFLLRNEKDDDDRWKRRREKLAEKVSVTGSRLAVVPAGGGS